MSGLIIGAYYFKPDGICVYVYACHNDENGIPYYYYREEEKDGSKILAKDCQDWVISTSGDYPNTKDPRVPYIFDLIWDIKRVSDIKKHIECYPNDRDAIIACIKSEGLDIEV